MTGDFRSKVERRHSGTKFYQKNSKFSADNKKLCYEITALFYSPPQRLYNVNTVTFTFYMHTCLLFSTSECDVKARKYFIEFLREMFMISELNSMKSSM
jgi:hypothetical protein